MHRVEEGLRIKLPASACHVDTLRDEWRKLRRRITPHHGREGPCDGQVRALAAQLRRHGRQALQEVLVHRKVQPVQAARDPRSPASRVKEVEPSGRRIEGHFQDSVAHACVSRGAHAAQRDRRQREHVAAAAVERRERTFQKTIAVVTKTRLRACQRHHKGEE